MNVESIKQNAIGILDAILSLFIFGTAIIVWFLVIVCVPAAAGGLAASAGSEPAAGWGREGAASAG